MKVKLKIKYNSGRLARQIPKIISKTMSRYARLTSKSTKKNIDNILKPPLKDSTKDIRKKRGISGNKPLFATGNLYNSIEWKKDRILMLEYGKYHDEGYITGEKSMIPNKKVPQREFIKPDSESMETIANDLERDLHKNFKK